MWRNAIMAAASFAREGALHETGPARLLSPDASGVVVLQNTAPQQCYH